MKKTAENRYPHSATLFKFCKEALEIRYEGNVKVIDQDVGAILGYDPADCSHWKKGKKNIRSIQAMKSIAEHLGVDEKLIVDVASGDLDDIEAFFEFSGYGAFAIDPKVFEAAKKDFYRRYSGSWTKDRENEFKDYFNANEAAIDKVVTEIHQRINFLEAPLYLPEVVTGYPDLALLPVDAAPEKEGARVVPVTVTQKGAETKISYQAGTDMRPYMRYRIAKAMGGHFLKDLLPKADDGNEYTGHLVDVQTNLFAAKLLAPANLLRREMAQINVAKDVVSQLSEVFWVSKTFMNRRLKEILQA